MDIRTISIDKIKPALYNPRVDLKPSDSRYKRIKQSIQEFGLVDPLIWNCQTGNLVGGHQRLKILAELKYKEVEVSTVDLAPGREKLLNLSLNKNVGDWDEDKLAQLIEEINLTPELDISLSGFELGEISSILDGINQPDVDDFDADAAAEAVTDPVTKRGDVLRLGDHVIFQRGNGFPVSWKSGNRAFPHFLSTWRYIGPAGNELPVMFLQI